MSNNTPQTNPIRFTKGGDGVVFFCPGCNDTHRIKVQGQGAWSFNFNAAKPTFAPSLLMTSGHYVPGNGCWCKYNAEHPDKPAPFQCFRCHSFVNNGPIQFLRDCTHALVGQTVPLPPWPHAPSTYGGLDEVEEYDEEAARVEALNQRESDCEQMEVQP